MNEPARSGGGIATSDENQKFRHRRGSNHNSSLSVCHVVNALTQTTGPADHARALVENTDVDAGLLAWFDVVDSDPPDGVAFRCLDAPDTALGIDARTVREARDFLGRYDVVHTHHPHSATFAKLLGRLEGCSLVFTSGTDHASFTRKGRVANGLTNAMVDRMTCVSPSVRDSMTRWERLLVGDRVEVVYTGVDVARTRAAQGVDWDVREAVGVPPGTKLVGHAGRLCDAKGQDTLVRGFASARRRFGDDVHLVVAGDGDLRDELERIAEAEGVGEHVTFLGLIPRTHAYKLMGDVDVFAMPSRWEGFSSAAVEAMSVGTACLYSDVPSLRDPFGGAARFHPVDDPDALGSELAALLADDATRADLGAAGKRRVNERFTMAATAREYARIYREIT